MTREKIERAAVEVEKLCEYLEDWLNHARWGRLEDFYRQPDRLRLSRNQTRAEGCGVGHALGATHDPMSALRSLEYANSTRILG